MSSISPGQTKLARSLKVLLEHWEETRSHWSDEQRVQFEEKHLVPLVRQVRSTLTAMDRLAEALRRAKSECSDEEG